MKEFLAILQKCPLFLGMTEENVRAVLGCLGAEAAGYAKRDLVLAEGEPARNVGIVLSGGVQIVRMDYFGNRSILANIGPGGLFGESFACAGVEELPVSVVAVEDTQVLLIDCARITQTCSGACDFHQQMIYNLMKVVAGKNLIFHEKLEITSKRTTRDKLLAYLALQAKKQDSAEFSVPFDRQELADYLEVDRSGLSAEISKMKKEGLIRCEKNRFALLPACREQLSVL